MATVSLQDLIVNVASALRDCIEGTATAGGGNTFADTNRENEKNDRYNGSEVFFPWPTGNAVTGTPPFKVTDFVQSTGTFTLPAAGNLGTINGDPYVILNIAGKGYPYAEIVRALKMGVEALRLTTAASDEATLPYVAGTYSYAIPAAFKTIEAAWVKRVWNGITYRLTLRRNDAMQGFEVLAGTRNLIVHGSFESGDIFGVSGEQLIALPTVLSDTITVPLEALVNFAVEWLERQGDQREAGASAGLYLDRLRTVPVYRRPNSIALP